MPIAESPSKRVRRAAVCGLGLALALLLVGCSENPLDPDAVIDPETFLFGSDESIDECDAVCDKLVRCVDYDRTSCAVDCPNLTPEQRRALLDATCEQLQAQLGG